MQIIKKTVSTFLALAVVWVSYVNVLFAQQDVDQIEVEGADLVGFIVNMLQWLIGLAGLVAAAVLILNGFMFITASGDEPKIQKATKGITYAIIGLIVAAIAFLIVNFVASEIGDRKVDSYNLEQQVESIG